MSMSHDGAFVVTLSVPLAADTGWDTADVVITHADAVEVLIRIYGLSPAAAAERLRVPQPGWPYARWSRAHGRHTRYVMREATSQDLEIRPLVTGMNVVNYQPTRDLAYGELIGALTGASFTFGPAAEVPVLPAAFTPPDDDDETAADAAEGEKFDPGPGPVRAHVSDAFTAEEWRRILAMAEDDVRHWRHAARTYRRALKVALA